MGLSMAGIESTRLNYVASPGRNYTRDDEIVTAQLQTDLALQAELGQGEPLKRAKKKRSRDNEGPADETENVKKKKKKRDHTEKRQRKLEVTGNLGEALIVESLQEDSHRSRKTISGSRLVEHTSTTAAGIAAKPERSVKFKVEKEKLAASEERPGFMPSMDPGRYSLTKLPSALLQSILKDCTPEKSKQFMAGTTTSSENPIESSRAAIPSPPEGALAAKNRKAGPKASIFSILPKGYVPGPVGSKKRFPCPVEGCVKKYTRRHTLGEHMNMAHAGQILNDNHDGTMTIVNPEELEAVMLGEDAHSAEPNTSRHHSHSQVVDRPKSSIKRDSAVLAMKRNTVGISEVQPDLQPLDPNEFKKPAWRSSSSERSLEPLLAINSSDDEYRPSIAGKPWTLIPNDSKIGTKLPTASAVPASISEHKARLRVNYESSDAGDDTLIAEEQRLEITTAPSKSKRRQVHKPASSSAPTCINATQKLRTNGSGTIMEDWEINPGIIRGGGQRKSAEAESEEDIAFSGTFVGSQANGIRFPNVNFSICRLAAGMTRAWEADGTDYRICSVASGKVQVFLGEDNFSIGPHGVWKIPVGELCNAVNRCYAEAVLHVISLPKNGSD